jgi:hypothetical protein
MGLELDCATTEGAAAHRQMLPAQSQNQSQLKLVPVFCGRSAGSARDHNLALRPTPTPINMLARDLDTVRVRNAIRAEILAILRDMGLNPSPTPPHKPKRPHLRVV